ncbi:MAG: histidine--tRNA ligase [Wujia sp.]
MAMKKKPVTGMKDILPREMEIRDYVIAQIKEVYKTFGFTGVETPCVEHIENLSSNQGGENEKLIFKILKRGDKLTNALANASEDGANLVDGGLRYDLTLPLSRYYANNANDLPSPFKALQMGNVWRADRPQRGRYRQFMQCDIDILGEPTILAEIELITATTTLLGKIGFEKFTIRLNNRKMLKAMAAYSGFEEKDYDSVFITLDKMDKIGIDGVAAELVEQGYAKESVDTYLGLFEKTTAGIEGVRFLKETLGDFLPAGVAEDLETIMSSVDAVKSADFKIAFDPTLVRGMSYYTGPIFEISMDEFGGSVGGGGRYDEMIGKFTGQSTPACGFSIGFERIVMLLLERDYQVPGSANKVAYLIEKNMPDDKLLTILEEAKQARTNGSLVNIAIMKKNKKFQKEQLQSEGYNEFREFYVNELQ